VRQLHDRHHHRGGAAAPGHATRAGERAAESDPGRLRRAAHAREPRAGLDRAGGRGGAQRAAPRSGRPRSREPCGGARSAPPTPGGFDVQLTLAGRAPAWIALVDVAGRSVLRRDLSDLGPGSHAVKLAPPAGTRPGLYWLRLDQEGRTATSRVAIVR